MIAIRTKSRGSLAAATMIALLATTTGASAEVAAQPVKEVLQARIGWEVSETGGKTCLPASEKCQPGKASREPGGFEYPSSVAGAPNGNVYVADTVNHRVQELTSTGVFVSMFGWEVNETKDKQPTATQAEKNICTAASKDVCKSGVEGAAPGQFGQDPESIAVDPLNGNVYVLDYTNERVEEFTTTGEYLLSIAGGTEHGELNTEHDRGNLLAVGGPEDLLYVGEEDGRVQAFEADGKWKREITGIEPVGAIAIDDSCALHKPMLTESTTPTCRDFDPGFGDLYVSYHLMATSKQNNVVHQFSPADALIGEPIKISPRHTGPQARAEVEILTLTTDLEGRLVVTENETFYQGTEPNIESVRTDFGSLYEANTGRLVTEFPMPGTLAAYGAGFNGNGELFIALTYPHEVLAYRPVAVGELVTRPASCVPGSERASNVTLNCMLSGEVDPYEVPGTEVSFEWGRTCALGTSTPIQAVGAGEVLLPVSAPIEGLRPHEVFCDRLTGVDQNVQAPELLTGEEVSFTTPSVPPKVLGVPGASFVKASSAVLSGELNPENASSEYFFEYAPGEAALESCAGIRKGACPGVEGTSVLASSLYGRIAASLEVSGLRAGTTYAYRLAATGEGGESAPGAIGTFTTSPAGEPQAQTLPASGITASSAIASGTVNPDGQAASYSFELGVYAGSATQYGVVFSGPAGAGSGPVGESLGFNGLQPGTTYAYRIAVSSGYIQNEGHASYGASVLFTTAGLPSILALPAVPIQLSRPPIAFPRASGRSTPKTTSRKCSEGKRSKHGKCTQTKKAKKRRKRPTHKR